MQWQKSPRFVQRTYLAKIATSSRQKKFKYFLKIPKVPESAAVKDSRYGGKRFVSLGLCGFHANLKFLKNFVSAPKVEEFRAAKALEIETKEI